MVVLQLRFSIVTGCLLLFASISVYSVQELIRIIQRTVPFPPIMLNNYILRGVSHGMFNVFLLSCPQLYVFLRQFQVLLRLFSSLSDSPSFPSSQTPYFQDLQSPYFAFICRYANILIHFYLTFSYDNRQGLTILDQLKHFLILSHLFDVSIISWEERRKGSYKQKFEN